MADADHAAPKRPTDLKRRSLVGLALAAGAILLLWLGGVALWALLTVGALVSLAEWAGLVHARRARLGIAMLILIVGMAYALPLMWGTDRATLALLLIAALVLALFPRFGSMSVGLGYIGTAAISILFLREQPNGFALALWTLAIVWATDIGAYFAGHRIGGAKLAPRISPNKTWAGLIGGMVAAGIVGFGIASVGRLPLGAYWLGAPLAVAAQLGDLFESGLKRRAGLKDSGTILPGHGGLLDRVDGVLPVAILVAALVANGSF
ncbi:phosphatidate cytidylyltransferase [uncultured Sphingomonas sp.]|uniref:phosphatidate cytidylyltransferase n=1 Tax=uncultured Sphingomonas sp. TaxID=158754 RepID=UPI0025E3CCFD|nr:phosphatidate cytidylyltransferase [uncultured Sphingomonas sp.]